MSKDVEILIVEGNLAESEHLKRILEQHEYRVSVEHNGKAALDAARTNPPQIVISGKIQSEINERNQVEQALSESEEHYRRIVETAQEGIWMLDEQAKTSYVNDRMAEILGYTADEMLGHSMYDFMDDESRIEAERNFQKRRDGIKEKHDFRFRRKDGTNLWAIVSANPIISDNDVFMGVVGLVTDITDRKLMEAKLRESEAQLIEAQRIAQIGSWMLDMKTKTITWSDELFRIFGYKPDEIVPSYEAYLRIVHPDDRDFVLEENGRKERNRTPLRHEHRLL
jgi:PAS domain S-box-containing protein